MPNRQVLTLRTLGAWGLRFGESPESESDSSPSKTLGFLVYLACSPGATARRERLVDLLWAHMEPDAGDAALRQLTWHLRTRFGEDLIRSAAGALTLAVPFDCDRASFLEAIEKQDFETAVRLYGGDFLPGFAAPGGAEFERWADVERWRLRSLFLLACDNLTRRWLAAGRFREATALARRARDADRDSEAGWRLLLEALAASGDSVSAAVEAEEVRRTLAEERRAPEPATAAAIRRALHEQTQAIDRGAALVTELVGRERQFTAITQAWDAARSGAGRHVHVEGTAGLGKTRLLHDVASRLRAMGAVLVEARANPGEQDVRYAFVAALAVALAELPGSGSVAPASAEALVALNPRLSNRYAAASRAAAARGYDARVFFLALGDLLDAVTEEVPLALMIDDVHWADGESRGLLAALLPRLAPRRVLLVTAARPGAEGRFERPDTQHLVLEPLSVDQVRLLLASAGSLPNAEWASGLPQALHRSTLGSPLLIVETLRLALSRNLLRLADGQWSSPDPVALYELLAQGGALHQRIVDLSRERRWLLTLLSTAGVPLHRRVLSAAVRRPEAEIAPDLDELNQLGLAVHLGDAWSPAHDAIAERLMEVTTPEQHHAAHAALGRALMVQPEETNLLRAATQHLGAASLDTEAATVATRWVRLRRAAGDPRSAVLLVSDLLGAQPEDAAVRGLVRALPLGARLRKRRVIALGGAALAVLALAGVFAAAGLATKGPGLLVGQWRQDPSGHWRLYARELTGRDMAAGHLALASLRRTDVVSWDRPVGDLRPGSPSTVLTTRAYPDSGGEDIVIGTGDRLTRVTRSKGDDDEGSWSPDGRLVALSTDRWDNASQSAIAVLDPANPDIVQRLTAGGTTRDVSPVWSPDGARIAFTRTHILVPQPSELCVVTEDGARLACRRLPGVNLLTVVGWSDPLELVGLFADSLNDSHLLAVNVETGATHELAEGDVGHHSVVAGWLACYCRRGQDEPRQLLLLSVADPSRALRLEPAVPPGDILVSATGRPTGYVDRLKIVNAEDSIPLEGPWQLGLRAWDAAGQPREPLAGRWWTSDTLIATADSAGQIHPRRPGSVTIYATTGGWRTDSIIIRIHAAATTRLLSENWRHGVGVAWVAFGTPRPFVWESGRGPALAPNGDSTFWSGVFARHLLPADEGLGVEFTASVPVTSMQWQSLTVQFISAGPSTASGWDLVKGQLAIPNEPWRSCGMTDPADRRPDRLTLTHGINRDVSAPPSSAHGRWIRIRLQLFPDGRCGIAADGVPLAVLDPAVPMGDSAMLLIRGGSYHTRILVGPLEVWRGVRYDLDWPRAAGAHR